MTSSPTLGGKKNEAMYVRGSREVKAVAKGFPGTWERASGEERFC